MTIYITTNLFVLQKLARRLKALGKMSEWSAGKTAKVADVLRSEYMSSEESETDENVERGERRYIVRSLAWESSLLTKIKKKLDKVHTNSLNGLVSRQTLPRVAGEVSSRKKPPNCPKWAHRGNGQQDRYKFTRQQPQTN